MWRDVPRVRVEVRRFRNIPYIPEIPVNPRQGCAACLDFSVSGCWFISTFRVSPTMPVYALSFMHDVFFMYVYGRLDASGLALYLKISMTNLVRGAPTRDNRSLRAELHRVSLSYPIRVSGISLRPARLLSRQGQPKRRGWRHN